MITTKTFQELSHERHTEHYIEYGSDGSKASHARTWLDSGTVDAFRHQRMYKLIDPLLHTEPESEWLTVGDGRYGKDSKYITDKGLKALPTDISDILLKESKKLGYIQDYRKENAESLSFSNYQFDYVLCKESYHHFPRPYLALYEMLRVAKKGVVLIEPNDIYINNTISSVIFRYMKSSLKYLMGKKNIKHGFEDSGNYVYCMSRREVEKVALGLNYPLVAFKGINDAFLPGVEKERISDNGILKKNINLLINTANLLCKMKLMDYTNLTTIIFKEHPSSELIDALTNDGYDIIYLPKNPYITS